MAKVPILEEPIRCDFCGVAMAHEPCAACGGEGSTQTYEEDGLVYTSDDPRDRVDCTECGGAGGMWVCPEESSERHLAGERAWIALLVTRGWRP